MTARHLRPIKLSTGKAPASPSREPSIIGRERSLLSDQLLRRISLFLALMCSLMPSLSLGADTTYHDPRQPSFTLLVPDGWKLSKTDDGIKIDRGTSWVQLFVQKGATEPGAILVQFRPQFERQWKNFREVSAGGVSFGGQKGAYAVYAGIPPSGVSGITKVVTMTNGRLTYTLFMGVHADEYDKLKRDLDRIQASFTPDTIK